MLTANFDSFEISKDVMEIKLRATVTGASDTNGDYKSEFSLKMGQNMKE